MTKPKDMAIAKWRKRQREYYHLDVERSRSKNRRNYKKHAAKRRAYDKLRYKGKRRAETIKRAAAWNKNNKTRRNARLLHWQRKYRAKKKRLAGARI